MTVFDIDASFYCADGYVHLHWEHTFHADHYEYRVYGRNVGEVDWTLLHEIAEVQTVYDFYDYLAAANKLQEWTVVQVTESGSVQTEETYDPVSLTPVCDAYWLIYREDPDYNLRIEHVTSDSFGDEYEEEIMLLIGRGRKADKGTNFGVVGSLSAEIRDQGILSAEEQKVMLEAFRELNTAVYLRNPFGDVWQIVLGKLDFTRVPGVGVAPYVTVTIPYTEVA